MEAELLKYGILEAGVLGSISSMQVLCENLVCILVLMP